MKQKVIFSASILIATLLINTALGQQQVIDYKAKLLYNTTRLVEWPEEYKNQDFVIGVFGNTQLSNHLKKLVNNRKVGTNNIIVKEIKSAGDIDKVHILYIASVKSTPKGLQAIFGLLEGKSTLIVTEKNGLTEKGSAINFVVRDNLLKFELKESNATKYGLKINSRLKQLAIVI